LLLWVGSPAVGAEGEAPQRQDYVIFGTELGGTGAVGALDTFANNGAVLAPFGGYMVNKYIGVLGNLHVLALPLKNACRSEEYPLSDGCYKNKPLESDSGWALGLTVGPRLALPLGGIELWGTCGIGGFTGLSGNSPIMHTSFAYSTGGGANIAVTDNISIGGFARYNYLFQDAHGRGRVRYGSGGVVFTYKMPPPQAAPPPK